LSRDTIPRQDGHKVVAASPQGGINTISGEGLKEAMVDTTLVIELVETSIVMLHVIARSCCCDRQALSDGQLTTECPLLAIGAE
jgi:hypothetical protein